jgi:hypothetical protein
MSTEVVDVVAQLGFEREIDELRQEIEAWVAGADLEIRPLLQWQFRARSKYYRPLTIFSCLPRDLSGADPPALVRSVCVLEMFQLVPIDVISCDMDLYNDRLRRRWLSELNSGYPAGYPKLDWRSNADLVKKVARIARSVGRPVATPDQARKMLALK